MPHANHTRHPVQYHRRRSQPLGDPILRCCAKRTTWCSFCLSHMDHHLPDHLRRRHFRRPILLQDLPQVALAPFHASQSRWMWMPRLPCRRRQGHIDPGDLSCQFHIQQNHHQCAHGIPPILCGGLHALDIVNLTSELTTYYGYAADLTKNINMLKYAHKKSQQEKLPIPNVTLV